MAKMITKDWMIDIKTDEDVPIAIRKMQKKVKELEDMMNSKKEARNSDVKMEVDDDAIEPDEVPSNPVQHPKKVGKRYQAEGEELVPDVAMHDEKGEPKKYHCVLRGKFDLEKNDFFRGHVDRQQYMQQQSETWKFVGNSSSKGCKLLEWIQRMQPGVDQENKTFYNTNGKFSKKWCTIFNYDGACYALATCMEVEQVYNKWPAVRRNPLLSHSNFKDAYEYIKTNHKFPTVTVRTKIN